MRQRNIIKKLEEKNKVPEKLAPQKIKDMLDELSMVKPIIENEAPAPEIKLTSNKGGFLRSIAIAAVFVLAVGGFVLFKNSSQNAKVKVHPNSPSPVVADTEGLEGVRGGSYKALYNFLADNNKHELNSEFDDTYFYMADDSWQRSETFDAEVSSQFKMQYNRHNSSSYGARVANAGSENEIYDRASEGDFIQQSGTNVFAAGYTDIIAYKMQGEETSRVDYDFWSETYLMTEMSNAPFFAERNHTFKAYILNTYLVDDRLVVLFGFHLPEIYEYGGDRVTVVTPYCGMCVYDVSDIDNISLVYECEQPGYLTGTQITADGSFVMMSDYDNGAKTAKYAGYEDSEKRWIPTSYVNGAAQPVAEDSIYLVNRDENTNLIVTSSFDIEADFEMTKQIVFTAHIDSPLWITENEILFFSYYYDSSEMEKVMAIRFVYEDKAVKVDKTAYITSEDGFIGMFPYFGEIRHLDGYYITAVYDVITPAVYIFDDDLKLIKIYRTYVDEFDYASDDSSFDTNFDMVFDGDRGYLYRNFVQYDEDVTSTEVIGYVDFTDVTDPKYVKIDDKDDIPLIIFDIQDAVVDEDTVMEVKDKYDSEKKLMTSALYLYSTDPGDSAITSYNEAVYDYEIGEKTDTKGKLVEVREQGIKAQTDFKPISMNFTANIHADAGSRIVYTDYLKEDIKTHPIGEDDAINSDKLEYVGTAEDGEQIFEIIDEYKLTHCLEIYRYDEKTYELTEIGSIDISTQSFTQRVGYYTPFTGAVTLNGKIYAFSDVGMSCYSLKNIDKPLYTDMY